MSGSQYIALSGLRSRVDELDRLAADLANVGTAGYKGVRAAHASAPRNVFDAALRTAIDTTDGGTQLDMSSGALASTGRPLDLAIEGRGFFVVDTAAGPRYTRNGHFTINAQRQLSTEDGALVAGTDGPITIPEGEGDLRIDPDGVIWNGAAQAGRLKIVDFDDATRLRHDQGTRLAAPAGLTPTVVTTPAVRAGALEQSNVSMADRMAQLTTVTRGFEAMQKAISLLVNDIDGRTIDQLGRR